MENGEWRMAAPVFLSVNSVVRKMENEPKERFRNQLLLNDD